MSSYKWHHTDLDHKPDLSKNTIQKLAQELGVENRIAQLLFNRNITTFEQAKTFFRPLLSDLNDPFLMQNMQKVVELIQTHIAQENQILIYGDYDVDGTCGVTILYDFFLQIGANVGYYIPNRYQEGYGVSEQGIDFAIDNDFKLLITVDCGIKANSKIKRATLAGIDVVVCDHHIPGDELPSALILNPKQSACEYPFKALCGTGIAYKLLQAIASQVTEFSFEPTFYLDFVALATAADMVELQGENRTLLAKGLEKINKSPHPGVACLMQTASCKSPLTMRDLVFGLAPRINAAGRIGEASRIVELFTSADHNLAEALGNEISADNEHRRTLDQEATTQAMILLQEEQEARKSNVVYNPKWNKGIIGIVASRILESYYKPTIVFTQNSDGLLTGSARSVSNFNIHDAISACGDLLESFGGHTAAAGLTLKAKNLNAFKKAFELQCINLPANLLPALTIEGELQLAELTPKFMRILDQMAPFGVGNPEPVFTCADFELYGEIRLLAGEHLKFKIRSTSYAPIACIAFKAKEWMKELQKGSVKQMAFTPQINEWQGKKSIQLNIKDFSLSK